MIICSAQGILTTPALANLNGNAATATFATTATNATNSTITANISAGLGYIPFVSAVTGNNPLYSTTSLTINPATGVLTAYIANINSGISATSTSTGALVVSGGAGVSGNVVAGNIYSTGWYWAGNNQPLGTIQYAQGATGQIQYNNGGLMDGSSNLYYDDINERIGIGTTTPSQKLEVNGSIAFTSSISPIALPLNFLALDGNVIKSGYSPLVNTVSKELGELFTTTSLIPLDDTIPQSDEGEEVLSVNITPNSESNYLYINANGFLSSSLDGGFVITSIVKLGQSDALCAHENYISTANTCQSFSMNVRIPVTDLDNQQYALRIGGSDPGTVSVGGNPTGRRFGSVGLTTLTVEERTS